MERKELGSRPGITDGNFPHRKQPAGSYLCYAACVDMLANYYNPTYMESHDETLHTIAEWYCEKEDEKEAEKGKSEGESKSCSERPQDLADPNWLAEHNIAILGPIGADGGKGKVNKASFSAQQTLLTAIKSEIDAEQPVILRLAPNSDAHFVCVYGYEIEGNSWKLMVSDPVKSGVTITIQYECNKSTQKLKDEKRVTVTSPGNGDTEEE